MFLIINVHLRFDKIERERNQKIKENILIGDNETKALHYNGD